MMTNNMDRSGSLPKDNIHFLLDRAFDGVEMTPDAQDLKEEIRANLVLRVAELEADGKSPADASHQAISELGDIAQLFDGKSATTTAEPMDRFEREPEVGARFGVYVVAIGILTIAIALVIGFTVGLLWSLLVVAGGCAVFFFVLARMLFVSPADSTQNP